MKIIFMGTPDFAVASLEALIDKGHQVVAVVTAPDRPAGRGRKLRESAVKQYAVQQNIPVLQPEKLRDPNFISQLQELKADLQVVVAFRMLPEIVWNMPALGTINVHASLLPQYRGAAPINHALINGETETGVTTFLLNHQIDTGNVLLRKKIQISNDDNVGTLHDKLMNLGADALIETIDGLKNNSIEEIQQDEMSQGKELKNAPKIFKDDCLIDWNKSSVEISNLVRGLSPYPGAFTSLNGLSLKIFKTEIDTEKPEHKPGEIISDGKTFLKYATADGYLKVTELQLEGKKRNNVEEFLRGNKVENK